MKLNKTSIKFYALTNDENGKIVLTLAGEIENKQARSRELVEEIERLKGLLLKLSSAVLTDCRLDEFDTLAIEVNQALGRVSE